MAGSGSETRKRPRLIRARCTEEELAAAQAAAEESGLSVGAFLRLRLLGSAGDRSVRRRLDHVELCRLLAELGKIGSNVNQMARTANTSGQLPTQADLAGLRNELIVVRDAVIQALNRRDGD